MAKASDVSSAVYDVMKASRLISDESPVRYLLLTTRTNLKEDASVRKWTFGQRDTYTQNKIILLVGETGTGKTTLINVLVNYVLGVKFNDNIWFEITDENKDDQAVTKTTQVTMYEVFAKDNPVSLTIIDTPGYGDTRGTEHDETTAANLRTLFFSDTGVNEVDAVCLVIKASENRVSDRFLYIFDSILSLFGKDIEQNIVVFFTHSDGIPPGNAINAVNTAKIVCKRNNDNNPEYFIFNNQQTQIRKSSYNKVLKRAWDLTEESVKDFFSTLRAENRKSLVQTKQVMVNRTRLEASVTNLQERIGYIEKKQDEMNQLQKAIIENQETIRKKENFTFTVNKAKKIKVDIENVSWFNRKATTCSYCEENCHEYKCWCASGPYYCEVMKNNHCTVCTNKCHYTRHVKENMKYVTHTEQITMTYKDLVNQYGTRNDAAGIEFDKTEFENVTEQLKSEEKWIEMTLNIQKEIKEDLTKTKEKKIELVEEAGSIIIQLCAISLKPDSAFILQSLDFLIPRAEETNKPELAQNLKALRAIDPESEEHAYAAIAYTYIKNTFKKLARR